MSEAGRGDNDSDMSKTQPETIFAKFFETKAKQKKRKVPSTESSDVENAPAMRPVKRPSGRKQAASTSGVPTKNYFEVLTDPETDDEQTPTSKYKNATDKIDRPTPIIVSGHVNDHKSLTNTLTQSLKGKFHIKYTANNTNIYLTDIEDKQKLVEIIKDEKLNFHTYTDKADKTHAFVLKGLDSNPDPEEILEQLRDEHKVKVVRVTRMRTTGRTLYMVIVSPEATLSALNREVKYVLYTSVTWERVVNKKRIVQCHRCQMWGHATSNCFRQVACVKCGEAHLSRECPKPACTPAKCANCAGPHTANSTECPRYAVALHQRTRADHSNRRPTAAATAPAPRYVPAPVPAVNAWSQRAAQRQQRPPAPALPPPLVDTLPTSGAARPRPMPTRRPQALPVPTPSAPSASAPTYQHCGRPQPVARAQQTPPGGAPPHELLDIFGEMRELQSKVNLQGVLAAIRDLNCLLTADQSKSEKLTVFFNFMCNAERYDI